MASSEALDRVILAANDAIRWAAVEAARNPGRAGAVAWQGTERMLRQISKSAAKRVPRWDRQEAR